MLLAQYRKQVLLLNFKSDLLSRSSNFFIRMFTYSHFNEDTISPSLVGFPSFSSIEVLDTETWRISSSLSHSWGGRTLISPTDLKSTSVEIDADNSSSNSPDLDEIEDMKIRGNLFYKILKNSKEYEEHCVRISGVHASKNQNKQLSNEKQRNSKIKGGLSKNVDEFAKNRKNKVPIHDEDLYLSKKDARDRTTPEKANESADGDICSAEKKVRVPTFNKLSAPYLFPFCLDIFTSKKSVKACVVHRVTNKVVVVAHSISKDLKMDLRSGRGLTVCAMVGAVLAQRALADDIYSLVYTPRKGEIIKGKIQDVLQSIIDNGVCVNIKLKQKNESRNTLPY